MFLAVTFATHEIANIVNCRPADERIQPLVCNILPVHRFMRISYTACGRSVDDECEVFVPLLEAVFHEVNLRLRDSEHEGVR